MWEVVKTFAYSVFTSLCSLTSCSISLWQGLLMVHRSAFHNFLHVFGRYWILHILIPFPRRRAITDPRSFLKIVWEFVCPSSIPRPPSLSLLLVLSHLYFFSSQGNDTRGRVCTPFMLSKKMVGNLSVFFSINMHDFTSWWWFCRCC